MVKLPVRFNPSRLVSDTEVYSTSVPVSQFKRFVGGLAAEDGEVRVEMRFHRERKRVSVVGTFTADSVMLCQRCMKSFSLALSGDFDLTFVVDEAAAQSLADELDPVVLDDSGQIHVVDMLEDDLLLQLPVAPRHENISTCFELGYIEKKEYVEGLTSGNDAVSDVSKKNPFDILKDFTNKD